MAALAGFAPRISQLAIAAAATARRWLLARLPLVIAVLLFLAYLWVLATGEYSRR